MASKVFAFGEALFGWYAGKRAADREASSLRAANESAARNRELDLAAERARAEIRRSSRTEDAPITSPGFPSIASDTSGRDLTLAIAAIAGIGLLIFLRR